MARSVPWRRTCNDLVFWRQTQAQNATIYILRETGPTGFLLKEEGEAKPCKAFLGDPHSCTCSQFMKDRDLCKHICWLLLKKFRVPQTNAMSWQKGLVEREINEILRGLTQQMRKKVPTAVARWRRPLSNDSDAREVIAQRDIAEDDVCPICQDELLAKRLPVTYCKFGCGNSIHIKCMKVWAEHQKTQGETTVKCPFCREDFGPIELLKCENRNAEGAVQVGRMDRHLGSNCQSCHTSPIEGKCYRCSSCADFHLCQACFNTPIHTQHAFQYRHKRNQRWRPAGRAYGAVLPQAVVDDLVNRDISDQDYELLMQLDSNAQAVGSDIPEDVVMSFPQEKVREHGPLLAPGMQCRVCLRGYQVGQLVRKLPRCKHKFHKDCIDNWLLHSKPTCPIDGQVVWDRITAQLDDDGANHNGQGRRRPTGSNNPSGNQTSVQQGHVMNLEIPGVGISLRTQDPTTQGPRSQAQPRGRGLARRHSDNRDRETERVLRALHSNFSLSGTAVGATGSDTSMTVPGGRLLNRNNARRATLNGQLSHHDVGVEYEPEQLLATHTDQNNDPLNEVILANQNPAEAAHLSPRQEVPSSVQPSRPAQPSQPGQHPGALFSQQTSSQPDITANLLSNIERLSPYRELPNIFSSGEINSNLTQTQDMTIESTRTDETSHSNNVQTENRTGSNVNATNRGSVPHTRPSNDQEHRRLFADVPPEQRLFSVNGPGGATSQGEGAQTGSQLLFNPGQPSTISQRVQGVNAVAAMRDNSQQAAGQGRQPPAVSSAPASMDGERGRRSERGRSQSNRGNSRERARDRSSDGRGRYTGPIPKEGENLLERLTLFSDLYLGNSPASHPPINGVVPTATGLPPRPQRRQYGNHAAARQRRFENERRKTNFGLEGSALSDVTLRDILS